MTALPNAPVGTADVRSTVMDVMRAVLERDVDPAVDVFDQGATSLAFVRALTQINETYAITVEVGELEEASVDAVAALVTQQLAGSGIGDGEGSR